jgi:hypothetical protein
MHVLPSQGGSVTSPPSLVDPGIPPETDPDWCTVARSEGASVCEVKDRELEYCVPAPAPAVRAEAGIAGADTGAAGAESGASGAAGAESGASGAGAGASGAGGAGSGTAECPAYDYPPLWVYDLVLPCFAHCTVALDNSERQLEGSCCYVARPVYGGR